jgi:gas vesicle protein
MGRFLLGFTIGAAIGAAVVIFTTPRSGAGLRQSLGDTFKNALEAARQADAVEREARWAEYRQRLQGDVSAPPTAFDYRPNRTQ